ncbi:MAG: hypothetical protein CL933_04620 [Deltaproteobacteria bacterium]|nr:hypothetical protein [Deltaproteobacteria bacterium]
MLAVSGCFDQIGVSHERWIRGESIVAPPLWGQIRCAAGAPWSAWGVIITRRCPKSGANRNLAGLAAARGGRAVREAPAGSAEGAVRGACETRRGESMIRHVVLLNWNEKCAESAVQAVSEGLAALPGKI